MSEGPHDATGEPVGSVGDEAAKLFGALADWAKDSSTGWAAQVDGHLATGAAECQYCPICRTVHVLREASPEVRTQLVTAASTFLQAAAGILGSIGAEPGAGERPSPVQRIDLDDDGHDDGDRQEESST